MSLTRDQILGCDDIKTEEVSVPEWGGVVRVKCMSGHERNRLEALMRERKGEDARSAIVAMSAVDESGELLFTPADVDALARKSWTALERVAEVAARVNTLTDAEVLAVAKN